MVSDSVLVVIVVGSDCPVDESDVCRIAVVVITVADVIVFGDDMVVECPFADCLFIAVVVVPLCLVDDVAAAMIVVGVDAVATESAEDTVVMGANVVVMRGESFILVPDVIALVEVIVVEGLFVVTEVVSVYVALDSLVVDKIDDVDSAAVEVRVAVVAVFSEVLVVAVNVVGVTDVVAIL